MALEFLSPLHKASRQISMYLERPLDDLTPQEGHLITYLNSYAPAALGASFETSRPDSRVPLAQHPRQVLAGEAFAHLGHLFGGAHGHHTAAGMNHGVPKYPGMVR